MLWCMASLCLHSTCCWPEKGFLLWVRGVLLFRTMFSYMICSPEELALSSCLILLPIHTSCIKYGLVSKSTAGTLFACRASVSLTVRTFCSSASLPPPQTDMSVFTESQNGAEPLANIGKKKGLGRRKGGREDDACMHHTFGMIIASVRLQGPEVGLDSDFVISF